MRILIIKLSPIEAITSSMFRTLAIARGLSEAGHKIDYLVVPMNKLSSASSEKEFIKELNVIRTSKSEAYEKNVINAENSFKALRKQILRKIWHSLSVYDYTYLIAKKIKIDILPVREYDIVISSSDPKSSHIVVENLRKQGLRYKRWIQYWGDPLSIDITQKSIYPQWVLRLIEKKLIKNSDKIVYASPFTLSKQKELFKDYKDKMVCIPTAYMEEEIYPATDNQKFIIGYYGDYTARVRNIKPFYNACRALGDKVSVAIYGDSDVKLQATPNIAIYDRGIVDEHKRIADLLICILNSSGTQIPGKLYHLAGTNKKVLVVVDGEQQQEMREFLLSFDRFYVCGNSQEEIENAIVSIMKDNKEFLPLPELKYDYIANRFIE